MASPTTIVVGVISGHLALAGAAAISYELAPGSPLLLLLATAWTPATLLGAERTGSFLLLLLVEGASLLHPVQQLDSGGALLGVRCLLAVLHHLEPPGDVLDGELLEVKER